MSDSKFTPEEDYDENTGIGIGPDEKEENETTPYRNKFTPGPWWLDDDGFIASGNGDTYATIADPNCTKDIDHAEREANTRLIANSPNLYNAGGELLRTVHDTLRRMTPDSPNYDNLEQAAKEFSNLLTGIDGG